MRSDSVAIILFVFGLEHFSKEIQKISGERFRSFIARSTRVPFFGLLIGAVVTALVQSSSATSVIAIGLVNAGVLSFKNSVGIIFGSNVGTTVTAQLVAFKLTSFAPIFLILGFILSFTRSRFAVFGKSIFYFGFVFFALNLISATLSPLQSDPRLISLLSATHSPFYAIVVGCIFTAIVQSSSVTTGLAVILTQQGIMSLENAIPLIMGANIGTTATAALAMFRMDIAARKTALCHFLFNFGGVLLFLPFIGFITSHADKLANSPAIALANFHLIFNVSTSLIFLLFLKPFTHFIDKLLGEGKMDFERLDLSGIETAASDSEALPILQQKVQPLFKFLLDNYGLVSLAVESNFRGVSESADKRLEYVDYLHSQFMRIFARLAALQNSERTSKELLTLFTVYDYLFQIHDSTRDILKAKKNLDEEYIEIQSDLLLQLRELSSGTLSLFSAVIKDTQQGSDSHFIKKEAKDLQEILNTVNAELLRSMSQPHRKDAGALIHIITYSQRLRDKLLNFARLNREIVETLKN